MKTKALLLFSSFVLLYSLNIQAQTNDYKFHSVFLYNFTKYIQWPASQQSGDFVIGVVGNCPIFEELQKITSNKMVGAQKIVVKKFRSVSDIADCQMLFVPSQANFDAVQEKTKGKSMLVITEKSGLAQKGSGINFVLQENKWKFELNESATQNAGLKISKELAKLAISV
jgi:hypothetical protein